MTETERQGRRFAVLDLFELAALRSASLGGWCIRRPGESHPLQDEPFDATAVAAVERSAGACDVWRVRRG